MTGSLNAVLAGRAEPGAEIVDDDFGIAVAAAGAGWSLAGVDTTGLRSKAEVLEAIGTALRFPDWYGANLDALVDCLRDVPASTLLVWHGYGDLAAADPSAYDAILDILVRRARDSAGSGRPFHTVLVRG